MIDGAQRLRNIKTKARIVGRRDMRAFLAGELDVLPCLADIEDEMIASEFERLWRKGEEREWQKNLKT